MRLYPTLNEEKKLWKLGKQHIAGVDEVGRGAFAGPVVAAAVILPQKNFPQRNKICDSKLLSAKQRELLAPIIQTWATAYAIAEVSVETINKVGIGKAAQQAFHLAVQKLYPQPEHILVDAFYIVALEKAKQTPIIKGDQLCLSIAAASIIAKVYRDNLMKKIDLGFKEFHFSENKGYGTSQHRNAIKKYGLCRLHRTSFNLQKYVLQTQTHT